MAEDLAVQIAKKFIQRRDVKAIQFDDGKYCPDTRLAELDAEQGTQRLAPYGPLGFKMTHLAEHLTGTKTYGHYMLDQDSVCKLFAFDIDLEKVGTWVAFNVANPDVPNWQTYTGNPREEWRDRSHPSRGWYKYQMKTIGTKLAKVITKDLQLPCAVTYTGGKGIHVYGFTGPMPANEVREIAKIAIDTTGEWAPSRGENFYKHVSEDPTSGFGNFSIEVFPKQDSLDGKDLGNLMRLPLGKNRKTTDPTFFVDMGGRMTELRPHANQARVLETGDPFRD